MWTVYDLRRPLNGDLMSIDVRLVGLDSQHRFRLPCGLDVPSDCVLIYVDDCFHGLEYPISCVVNPERMPCAGDG